MQGKFGIALVKVGAAGFNEGNPKWGDMPRDARSNAFAAECRLPEP